MTQTKTETQTDYEKWATQEILDDELGIDCLHCDAVFPQTYLRWHFLRRTEGKMTVLTCRECGLWTPVRFEIK